MNGEVFASCCCKTAESRGCLCPGKPSRRIGASDDGLDGMHVHEHRRRPSSVIRKGPCIACRMPPGPLQLAQHRLEGTARKTSPQDQTGPSQAKHNRKCHPTSNETHESLIAEGHTRPPKTGSLAPRSLVLVETAPAPKPNAIPQIGSPNYHSGSADWAQALF